jgi:putative heme-binding domain-containing protein
MLVVCACLLSSLAKVAAAAEELDYSVADPELKVVRLDSAPTESFLAVRADTEGRLFVGGREALFVYEPNATGGYEPRRELLHFPDHTWVYDIEIRGNDLYILTVSALYVIPEGRVQREGLVARRLVWGVPMGHVHQCFHGLTLGPEGDIYFAMGDPLWYYGDFNRPDHWGHWTFFSRRPQPLVGPKDGDDEWVGTPYTGVGGVFRCRPDGSHLQVVARGLRNSCGLVFDRHWNLFTNDNDHEAMPAEYVPGRLNHVTPHSYFSWPRGWMLSKTPDRMDLLDTLITTLGRAVPVGQAYYHETFFPEKYRDNLLVARWCTRQVTRYPLQHDGATFKTEEHELLNGRDLARPVGVSVGRGGRIFATICYMAQNEGSPTYKSDVVMITRQDDSDAHPHDAFDITQATPAKLFEELSQASWQPRYRAHQEILRRGGRILTEAAGRLKQIGPRDPALVHLPWLAAASRDPAAQQMLTQLVKHSDPAVRLQAVRVLGEHFPDDSSRPPLMIALADKNPQVQHAAVLAFFTLRTRAPLPGEIISGPARGDDTYLRQAAALLLAERAPLERLAVLCGADDPRTRLAGVLAAGFRLTLPPTSTPLADNLPLEKWRNPEAYTIQFIDKKVDLHDLGRIGTFTVAEHWKAAPHSSEQEELFTILQARLSDKDEKVRLQAAHFLYMLNDSRTEPAVAQVRSDVEKSRLSTAPIKMIDKIWLAGPFPDGAKGFATVHPPEQAAINLESKYPAAGQEIAWQTAATTRHYNLRDLFGNCDRSSCYAYTRLESARRQPAMLLVGSDDGVKVWHNGKVVWVNEITRGALPFQDVVPLDLQPGSNEILIRVQNVAGESGLYAHVRALQTVEAVLPDKLGLGNLAERLKAAAAEPNSTQIDPEFFTTDWTVAVAKGDAERGRKLFSAQGLGCAKCHGVTADAAGNAGPSLADAMKRFTIPFLVESVLLPGKQVSPVFKATLVVTTAGKTHSGLVVGETAEKLEMILTDATRLTILKTDVEQRKLQEISPMPQGLVKTPQELRDLLAYLLSPNPAAP